MAGGWQEYLPHPTPSDTRFFYQPTLSYLILPPYNHILPRPTLEPPAILPCPTILPHPTCQATILPSPTSSNPILLLDSSTLSYLILPHINNHILPDPTLDPPAILSGYHPTLSYPIEPHPTSFYTRSSLSPVGVHVVTIVREHFECSG